MKENASFWAYCLDVLNIEETPLNYAAVPRR